MRLLNCASVIKLRNDYDEKQTTKRHKMTTINNPFPHNIRRRPPPQKKYMYSNLYVFSVREWYFSYDSNIKGVYNVVLLKSG